MKRLFKHTRVLWHHLGHILRPSNLKKYGVPTFLFATIFIPTAKIEKEHSIVNPEPTQYITITKESTEVAKDASEIIPKPVAAVVSAPAPLVSPEVPSVAPAPIVPEASTFNPITGTNPDVTLGEHDGVLITN